MGDTFWIWAAAVAGLGPRWRPLADPGRGQNLGHEWCHWGRQEAALRAMVSARSERFLQGKGLVLPIN